MALEFNREITKRISDAEITFATIEDSDEQKWANIYGLNRVCRISREKHLASRLPFPIYRLLAWLGKKPGAGRSDYLSMREQSTRYLESVKASDVVINMSGIAYVGDGSMGLLKAINDAFPRVLAKKFKKPYAAFIQSYGPFRNPVVTSLARKEFTVLPFIPARGVVSAEECLRITGQPRKIHDLPDIAIRLPKADSVWLKDYLGRKELVAGNYFLLAPSAVISDDVKNLRGLSRSSLIAIYSRIAEYMLKRKRSVLLLGHMYDNKRPSKCDRTLAREILHCVAKVSNFPAAIKIVEEDIDPMQAKSLISASNLAFVSRYHALVAAVSTATPVISLGWNVKYRDLLHYYGLDNASIDVQSLDPNSAVSEFERLLVWWTEHREKLVLELTQRQVENEQRVVAGFNLLENWIQSQRQNPVIS